MLIRIHTNEIVDFPDELAALVLADPSSGDDSPEFTPDEVNVLIHGILGTFYDLSMSYSDNVNKISERYNSIPAPNDLNYSLALESIHSYNKEIEQSNIGLVEKDLLFTSTDTQRLN
jgi:hypothetical protein